MSPECAIVRSDITKRSVLGMYNRMRLALVSGRMQNSATTAPRGISEIVAFSQLSPARISFYLHTYLDSIDGQTANGH